MNIQNDESWRNSHENFFRRTTSGPGPGQYSPITNPHPALRRDAIAELRAKASQRLREAEFRHRHEEAVRRAASLQHLSRPDRLMVPGSYRPPSGSSQGIVSLFAINRLGYNAPPYPPTIARHAVKAQPGDYVSKGSGITVYGRNLSTGEQVPVLIIKTKLITKRVLTELPALSNDVITRKPAPPLVIDLSSYDSIRTLHPPYDALVINVGGDFAFLGGTGVSLQIVIILKGNDQGIYVYRPEVPNANLGVSLSVGISTGTAYFNESNKIHAILNRATFEGNGQGWSAGIGGLGIGVSTSYVDGKRHYKEALGLDQWHVDKADILYRAYTGTAGGMAVETDIQFGGQYSFSRAKLTEWGSFLF